MQHEEERAAMVKFSKPLILLAVGVGCVLSLLWIFTDRRIGHTMANGAATDIHQMTAEALEREIRSRLPTGSPLATVEDFLKKREIEFSFEASSKTLYATAHKLKGSTMLASKSLTLKFHFDDALNLKSIDTKVLYTGP
jgi:hypothetical protein